MCFKELINLQNIQNTGSKLPANLYLTGLMGAGKTTVGRLLASTFGVEFYDTDEVIASALGMSINEIFALKGEVFFRDKETELLQLLAEKPAGTCVVSTGGGIVLRKQNREAMRKKGLIIFLEVAAEEAFRRLSGKGDRPLLDESDGGASLENMLRKRMPFYREADMVIRTTDNTAEEIIGAIREVL